MYKTFYTSYSKFLDKRHTDYLIEYKLYSHGYMPGHDFLNAKYIKRNVDLVFEVRFEPTRQMRDRYIVYSRCLISALNITGKYEFNLLWDVVK